MKKTLLVIVATTFAFAAQAEVIKLNVYQNKFSIEKSTKQLMIVGAKQTNVSSEVDKVKNPKYGSTDAAPEHNYTVLKTEDVVQFTVSLAHQEFGEIEAQRINVNLPLSLFTSDELAYKTISRAIINSKIKMEILEEGTAVQETVCRDRFYDEYNRGLEGCPKKEVITYTLKKNVLKISPK